MLPCTTRDVNSSLGPNAAGIFVKDDIKYLMHTVFNAPMTPHERMHLGRGSCLIQQRVPLFRGRAAIGAVLGFHQRHTGQIAPAIAGDYGDIVIEMEVMPDYGHLLLDVDPRAEINVAVDTTQGFTSHELRNEFPWRKQRLPTLWTRSTFISTVGAVTREVVQRYLEHQKGV